MRRDSVTTLAEILGFAALDASATVLLWPLSISAALAVCGVLLLVESALIEHLGKRGGGDE